jgi:hypothetical protein
LGEDNNHKPESRPAFGLESYNDYNSKGIPRMKQRSENISRALEHSRKAVERRGTLGEDSDHKPEKLGQPSALKVITTTTAKAYPA